MEEMNSNNHEMPEYLVGYGKPPRHTRFQTGKSGNPNGRPKKSTTFDDDVDRELSTPITVLENGKRRRITKQRAIAKQHVNRALGGDVRSTELLVSRSRQPQHSGKQDNLPAVLEGFRERHARNIAADKRRTSATDTDPSTGGDNQ
jgi:hypothetical protein